MGGGGGLAALGLGDAKTTGTAVTVTVPKVAGSWMAGRVYPMDVDALLGVLYVNHQQHWNITSH